MALKFRANSPRLYARLSWGLNGNMDFRTQLGKSIDRISIAVRKGFLVLVTVHYHALLREGTRKPEEAFELPEGAKVEDLVRSFCQRYPSLSGWRAHLHVAVNDEFAEFRQNLQAGDRVDLLPPFGGG